MGVLEILGVFWMTLNIGESDDWGYGILILELLYEFQWDCCCFFLKILLWTHPFLKINWMIPFHCFINNLSGLTLSYFLLNLNCNF